MSVEEEALASALSQVAAQFTRPDQLEKLPELKKRADRKKASVEAMLRTGVQSQLEGIRTAIAHLKTAPDDIQAIQNSLNSIRIRLVPFPALKEKMKELRDANQRHGQYAAAMENLKHIFNINNTVEATREAISQNKLLVAHKNIMELELARDELLFEIHKLPSAKTEHEKNLLMSFFRSVDELVVELSKNMWFIIGRALEMVKGSDSGAGPQELVTALRIVEREERIDKYYIDRRGINNDFMPPGRPRQWRKKTMEVLEKTVWSRVEGNQLEDRTNNKQWLARYLEVCRRVVIDDLCVARTGAVPCFPPEYQIYDRFVAMYHGCISRRLREIASERLEKNELVQLLSWIQAYSCEEMLGNRRLAINAPALLADAPLLTKASLANLCDQFVDMTQCDLREWLKKTLDVEKDEWYKHVRPEEDADGYLYTQLPSILFGMIQDTIALGKEISVDVIPAIMHVSIEEFLDFAAKYKDAAMAYKGKYFEDRSRFPQFTSTMIAVANNLHTCRESTDRQMRTIRLTMEEGSSGGSTERRGSNGGGGGRVSRQQLIENVDQLNARWNGAMQSAVNGLLEEICADLAPALAEIFTRKWWVECLAKHKSRVEQIRLQGCNAVETVCMTLHDYNEDYLHLRPHIRCALLMELEYKVVGEYLRAIESRRLTFATYQERELAHAWLDKDAEKYKAIFEHLTQGMDDLPVVSDLSLVLKAIAEVIGLKDKLAPVDSGATVNRLIRMMHFGDAGASQPPPGRSLLSLEVTGFGRKFPDVSVELLTAMLQCREDVGRNEARSIAEEALSHVKLHPRNDEYLLKLFERGRTDGTAWTMPQFDMQNVFSSLINK